MRGVTVIYGTFSHKGIQIVAVSPAGEFLETTTMCLPTGLTSMRLSEDRPRSRSASAASAIAT